MSLKQESDAPPVCPVCSSYVCHMYFMQDVTTNKKSRWFSCSCGVVFQDKQPDAVYDKKYWDKYNQFDNKIKPAYEYPVRIYSPLIEELIYGRKVLLIGRQTPHQEEAFAKRGWVTYSIDKNTSFEPSDRLFVGDFETYEFPEGLKFDLIWMNHTLECFINPVTALKRCHDLLTEDGIIYLDTVDSDFIYTRGSTNFKNWKPETNYIMWNRRALMGQLEKLGFTVIMARQNCWGRFPDTDDIHLICQKKFF